MTHKQLKQVAVDYLAAALAVPTGSSSPPAYLVDVALAIALAYDNRTASA